MRFSINASTDVEKCISVKQTQFNGLRSRLETDFQLTEHKSSL